MSEIRRNEAKHKLMISIDESSLVDVKHRMQHDDFYLTIDQGDELYERWPEIRAAAVAAWNLATAGPFADSDIDAIGGAA